MQSWKNSLEKFCTLAKANNIDYYLIGSITASVRGVEIIPSDIDLIVDVGDLEKTKKVFAEFIKTPFVVFDQNEPIKYFGVIQIDDFKIEISAYPKNNYGRHRIEIICWNGHLIKTQTLEMLEQVYLKHGKKEKAQKIRDYLESELLII